MIELRKSQVRVCVQRGVTSLELSKKITERTRGHEGKKLQKLTENIEMSISRKLSQEKMEIRGSEELTRTNERTKRTKVKKSHAYKIYLYLP
mmetsp:Transcript_52806/g.60465  ORF Transcript_52806/g.60465 Transcript_52806/m.60465 type:complete len:92 (-) Transcript_52806:714-989(-)